MNYTADIAALVKEYGNDYKTIAYVIKLDLLECGVPIVLNPCDLQDERFKVESGKLQIRFDKTEMRIHYEPET